MTEKNLFPNRETIPAREIGITLIISDESLLEIEKIKIEEQRAREKPPNIMWR